MDKAKKNRLYRIWHNMKTRCYLETAPNYKYYGGKGIKVCNVWRYNFYAFYYWAVDNGYSNNLEIDRINNNGDYELNNCRWVDKYIQNNNTKKNKFITWKNKTQTIAQWAKEYGLYSSLVAIRLRRGWSIEKALTA